MDERRAARITVRGRVQGVFFRSSALDSAKELGVAGWVRNLPDGGVELLAEGEASRVREFIAWCRRGPPMATVTEIETAWVEPGGLTDFSVRQ